MKLKLFFIFFVYFSASAQNLSEILSVIKDSKEVSSLRDRSYSDIAFSGLETVQNTPELELSVAHAEDPINSGIEYAVGVTQSLNHPFSASTKNRATEYMNQSIQQELKHELHLITLEAAAAYHSTCVALEVKEKSRMLYVEQEKRFKQFERAYELGDIPKTTLLFNKLDLIKLKKNTSVYKREYLVALSSLQSFVDTIEITEVSCDDLYAIQKQMKLNPLEEHGEIIRLGYETESSQSFYDVYNATFQSIGYGLAFEQELQTKRFTFGVTLPLGFLTSKNEKQKAYYLNQSSALEFQKDALIHKIGAQTKSLVLKIQTLFDEYTLINEELLPLSKELLELSKTALIEGEGTIMEYLDSSRSYSQNVLELLQIKKNYYNELFELYKIADLELGENYE